MTVTPDLDLGSLLGTSEDGRTAVLTVGAVLAVAAVRVVVLVLVALVKALVAAAVVATVLWVGYEVVQGLEAPASVSVPADPLPTMGSFAPR